MRKLMVVSAIAGALMLTACGSSSKSDSGSASTQTIAIEIRSDGCKASSATVPAGPAKFEVTNKDADSITEVELKDSNDHVVAEKENLTPGLSGSFNATLSAGTYEIECPGGESGTLTVTG